MYVQPRRSLQATSHAERRADWNQAKARGALLVHLSGRRPAAAAPAEPTRPAAPAHAQGAVKSVHGDWQIRCDTPAGAQTEQCALIQSVVAEDRSNAGLTVIILKTADQKSKLMRVVAPLGVLLPSGLGLKLDNQDVGRAGFVRCLPNGCVAEVMMDDKLLGQLKGAKTATFIIFQTPEEAAQLALKDGEGSAAGRLREHEARREALRKASRESREQKAKFPAGWVTPAALAALREEFENARQAEIRAHHVDQELEGGHWEVDASVVERHARMAAQVHEQDTQLSDRRASNEMARIAAFNARERYIDVLRATVRRYKKNVAELGELAGTTAEARTRADAAAAEYRAKGGAKGTLRRGDY